MLKSRVTRKSKVTSGLSRRYVTGTCRLLRLYRQVANVAEARRIVRRGFTDSLFVTTLTKEHRRGVWLAECLLDADSRRKPITGCAGGAALVEVRVPIERIRRYKIENRKPDRIFLAPPSIINRYPRRRLSARDEDDLCEELFQSLTQNTRLLTATGAWWI